MKKRIKKGLALFLSITLPEDGLELTFCQN